MKILKYIIFLSILTGIFFSIYRESDQKGLRKLWISFKIAVLVAAIGAGLIPLNTEAIESPGNNNQVYQERLLSEQEFNSFEDNDGQIILAKADGNPVTPPTNRGPSNFPTGFTGRRHTPHVNPYRTPPRVDQGLGAGANPAGAGGEGGAAGFDDQCSVPENQKSQESKVFGYDYPSNAPKKKKQSEDQCPIDEVKTGIANDGTLINAEKSQVRDKGLHIPDFLDAETLAGKFDVTEAENLEYLDRLKYLRDKNNLPDEIVIKARDKILDFMTADDTKLVPGFLGYSKIEGTVFINLRLNKVGFRDNNGYRLRTAMTMNDDKILTLAETDFHLFPDAGKP